MRVSWDMEWYDKATGSVKADSATWDKRKSDFPPLFTDSEPVLDFPMIVVDIHD